ncbi:hypothetical protein RE474_13020 [Methanolobus sediminis]|uniref:Uncharacterized protein n=1 Tax=Methanolobus sediminis TaxID=3072978 RepID=A0AA51UK16_9EURY|nr:hypothetical protein [Methanolobus sediminis]WMW24984.1 hypothetical protein RE474_13020 [Methanolobus sediminis]
MDKKDMKKKEMKDIEIPSLDEQIDTWCTVPDSNDSMKSAADLEVDAWCDNTTVEEEEKKKKEKMD